MRYDLTDMPHQAYVHLLDRIARQLNLAVELKHDCNWGRRPRFDRVELNKPRSCWVCGTVADSYLLTADGLEVASICRDLGACEVRLMAQQFKGAVQG